MWFGGIEIRRRILIQLVQFILTFLGVTFLSFLLIYLAPSDPAEIMLSRSGGVFSEEQLVQKREELGLNDPLGIQYGKWLKNILRGDLGNSMHSRQPVMAELTKAVPNTLSLSIATLLFSFFVSLLLGMWSAMLQGSIFDRCLMLLVNFFASMPGYFASLILLYVFSLKLKLFPVILEETVWPTILLPIVALSVGLIAPYTRQIRAVVSQESKKLYVLGADSRGISKLRIYGVHILRNCAATLLTMAGVSFGVLLGGSIIVETIFGWPGLGRLAMDAIHHRDYTMIQGYIVVVATAYFIINCIVDGLSSMLDPRQKIAEEDHV